MSGVIRLPNNHIYAHSPIFGGTRKQLGDSVHTDVIQRYSIAGNTLSNCGGHRMWSHLSCCQHSRPWILTRHRHTDTRQVSILSISGQNPRSKMLTMRPRNLLSHRIFIEHGHGVSLARSCMPNVHIRFVGDTGGQVQERSPCHRAASSAAPQAIPSTPAASSAGRSQTLPRPPRSSLSLRPFRKVPGARPLTCSLEPLPSPRAVACLQTRCGGACGQSLPRVPWTSQCSQST
jgi:hypothetical protein